MKINLVTKRIGAAFLGLALCATFAVATVQKASANEGNGNSGSKMSIGAKIGAMLGIGFGNNEDREDWREDRREAGMQPQVAIGVNGKVLVRGAKVKAISGNTITAQVSWGSFVSEWKVDASNAKFLRYSGNASAISEVSVGDVISFSGALDTSVSNATVKTDIVKDWSLDGQNSPRNGTLQGELKAMGGTTAPTTMTLEVKGKGNVSDDDAIGNFTVNIAANTAILNKNWGSLSLGNFEIGDSVRFYGLINADNTANATVVRNVSR